MNRVSTAVRNLAHARERVRRFDSTVGAPLAVLAYHRVATPRSDPWRLAVSAANLGAQIDLMRDRGEVAPLDMALARRRRRVGRRACYAITFDDGYVDNLDAALRVLEQHDAPATMFIPTHFIGGPRFWWDRLDAIVLDAGTPLDDLADAFAANGVDVAVRTDHAAYHAELHERITELGPDEIERALDNVISFLGTSEPVLDGRPMTADELLRLAGHPLITIGAHTVHHRMLTKLPDRMVVDELVSCTRRLDELLGPADRVLAYPHGRTDRRVAALARRSGFRHALTTDGRNVARSDSSLRIPRVNPTDLGPRDFERWLAAPS